MHRLPKDLLGYLPLRTNETARLVRAVAFSRTALKFSRGLARHHALADALALKARFEAVHRSTA